MANNFFMQRIYLLLSFLILFQENIISQEIESIWISSYRKDLRKSAESSPNFGDSLLVEEEVIESDTFYTNAYMLIEFKNSKEIIIKGIGGKSSIGTYKIRKGKLKIKIKNEKLKGRIENDNVVLSFKYSKYLTEEFYFEKIRNSELDSRNLPDSSEFYNTYWKVITDTNSTNYGVSFHFLDSNQVILTRDYGKFGFSNWGEFNIDKYGNHLFISVLDRQFLEDCFFNVYKQNGDTFYANNYDVKPFSESPPPLIELKLKKLSFLEDSEIAKIKDNLIGNWSAINEPIPNESDLWGYSLENQYYNLEFDTSKFRIIKGAVLNDGITKNPKEIILTGNWEISPTGNYLKLHVENSWTRFLTINLLENDYAEFFLCVEAIEEPMKSTETIKMKKITSHNN